MPLYDVVCPNKHEEIDVFKKIEESYPMCSECGEQTERLWRVASSVIQDSIEGGVWMDHGICNDDGTPRKYYTKSEMAKVAREKGLINKVRHVGDKGSDKNKNTQRWI